ncbi:hypothetical protein SAMN04489730_7079 [Amycolatopsis australiensis]|uniref:Uncharacterized protein n=1 Tax=Amycolatopsis australiensis TaxID=546364 RepID=A0A1K1SWU1_9PSEU|nr:hypothetical protein SAMN04489730_7079 [Amycolatopsis australiensis]
MAVRPGGSARYSRGAVDQPELFGVPDRPVPERFADRRHPADGIVGRVPRRGEGYAVQVTAGAPSLPVQLPSTPNLVLPPAAMLPL